MPTGTFDEIIRSVLSDLSPEKRKWLEEHGGMLQDKEYDQYGNKTWEGVVIPRGSKFDKNQDKDKDENIERRKQYRKQISPG